MFFPFLNFSAGYKSNTPSISESGGSASEVTIESPGEETGTASEAKDCDNDDKESAAPPYLKESEDSPVDGKDQIPTSEEIANYYGGDDEPVRKAMKSNYHKN